MSAAFRDFLGYLCMTEHSAVQYEYCFVCTEIL